MASSKSSRRRRRRLQASSDVPSEVSFSGDVSFTPESLEAGDGTRVPTFDVVAYNGGKMEPSGVSSPVVIQLSGIMANKSTPVFLDHDTQGKSIVGHADVSVNQRVEATGTVSGDTDAAETVVNSARRGFPWKLSVGGRIVRSKMIPRGSHANVNGKRHAGPFLHIKSFDLREVSFVPIAADNTTSAAIAAKQKEGNPVDEKFKEWLEAMEFDVDNLQAPQLKILQASFEATQKKAEPDKKDDDIEPPSDDDIQAAKDQMFDQISSMREAAALELERQEKIQKIIPAHSPLQAKAIAEGWTPERAELEWLRANRKHGPGTGMAVRDMHAKPTVIEAALCRRMGMDGQWLIDNKCYDEATVEAADSPDYANYGFASLCIDFLTANGQSIPPGISTDSLITRTKECYRSVQASMGYSTISLPGIFSNVLNKRLLQSFSGVTPVAQRLSATRSVRDFKKTYAFRLTGNGEFLEVGPTGEIKAMSLQEEQYENQAKTFGRIISISRNMLINDDLGALAAIPTVLGRKAALKLQKEWFTLFLTLEDVADPNSGNDFFSGANGNRVGTAATPATLSIDGLTTVEQYFLNQTDADGDPISVMPYALLVPTTLKVTAEELMNSTTTMMVDVAAGSSPVADPMDQSVKTTVVNPHVGKWVIEATQWLNNQNLAGSSETEWYLFANPSELAAMEIVYLNGRSTPFIQSEDADFSTLGFHYRSYFDFGITQQDYRAVVKATQTDET